MNSKDRLIAAIRKHTNLDPLDLITDILDTMFDDRLSLVGDILKLDAETLGKVLKEQLEESIKDVVSNEEKSVELDRKQEASENRRDFDKNEART